jgi:hypothetical protein
MGKTRSPIVASSSAGGEKEKGQNEFTKKNRDKWRNRSNFSRKIGQANIAVFWSEMSEGESFNSFVYNPSSIQISVSPGEPTVPRKIVLLNEKPEPIDRDTSNNFPVEAEIRFLGSVRNNVSGFCSRILNDFEYAQKPSLPEFVVPIPPPLESINIFESSSTPSHQHELSNDLVPFITCKTPESTAQPSPNTYCGPSIPMDIEWAINDQIDTDSDQSKSISLPDLMNTVERVRRKYASDKRAARRMLAIKPNVPDDKLQRARRAVKLKLRLAHQRYKYTGAKYLPYPPTPAEFMKKAADSKKPRYRVSQRKSKPTKGVKRTTRQQTKSMNKRKSNFRRRQPKRSKKHQYNLRSKQSSAVSSFVPSNPKSFALSWVLNFPFRCKPFCN